MIDHVAVNCTDLEASSRFYDVTLGALGNHRVMDLEVTVGYGVDKPEFWISRGDTMGPNRETHLAFSAADPAAVQAFHDAAVGLGAEVLHAPRLWPEYHPGYYATFVRDPDGNNVEAVCHHGSA